MDAEHDSVLTTHANLRLTLSSGTVYLYWNGLSAD